MTTIISNHNLADFCRKAAQMKTKYLWGTYGSVLTADLIAAKAKQYPKRYSEKRQKYLAKYNGGGYRACDCAGLIKWALWTKGDISKLPKYSSKTDRNCGMLWDDATERQPITKNGKSTLPEQEGIIVWKSTHVGVYLGGGLVAECMLSDDYSLDGVVITPLTRAGWTHWIKIPEILYCPVEKKDGEGRINQLKNILKGLLGL